MPKRVLPLSDLQVLKAKPKDKEYTLFDGLGLFLLVTPTGGKLWRFKYKFAGTDKKASFGPYPEITLSRAREKRLEARRLIAEGLDPGVVKKSLQAMAEEIDSFEAVAREWHLKFSGTWSSSHAKHKLQRLEKEIFPWIGEKKVSEVTPLELLSVLRRVEDRGALDTAHRIRFDCGQVFRYAIAIGKAMYDITPGLRGALPPVIGGHHAAPTDPEQLKPLLQAISAYNGGNVVRAALQLAPLLFVRPGELRHAEWVEIDLDGALWNIPAGKMKMKVAHIVPLSRQAVLLLRDLQPLTGRSPYVFPGGRSYLRPMSENAVNAALRSMGFDKETVTGHGFRATARTILDELLGFRPDIIEHQLAHQVKDPNGRAYNRTAHLEERRRMMQVWADYLEGLAT